MQQEVVTILKVNAANAAENVTQLKDNIKALRGELEKQKIGTEEYQGVLKELEKNQYALKTAIHATATTMPEFQKQINATGESYNSLVKQMADLKSQLRSVDVSTEEGKKQFGELATQINNVNTKLKEMDAAQGNYQRNVGMYNESIKNMGEYLKKLPPTLGAVKEKAARVGETLQIMGKQPILGTIGLLAPVIMRITASLKDNKTAMDAVKKLMEAFKPVMDSIGGILEKVAGLFSKVVGKIVEFTAEHKGAFSSFVAGAVGVGNTIKEVLLAPINAVITAFKGLRQVMHDIVYGEFDKIKEDSQEALSAVGYSLKNGFSLKQNFEAGKKAGMNFLDGLKSPEVKGEAENVGEKIANAIAEGLYAEMSEIDKEVNDSILADFKAMDKAVEESKKQTRQLRDNELKELEETAKRKKDYNKVTIDDTQLVADKEREIDNQLQQDKLALLKQFSAEAKDARDYEGQLAYDKQIADLEVEIEHDKLAREQELRKKDAADAKKTQEAKLAILATAAAGVSSILGSIADMYEANGEADVEAQKKAKNLRIASATIDTIQGAITAYMKSQELGQPWGTIIGAIQAAVVTATGIANIQKIKNTDVSGSTTTTATPSVTASVASPSVSTITETPQVQSNTAEATLNQIANSPQRVYILQSDIEAANKASKVQVSESTFV